MDTVLILIASPDKMLLSGDAVKAAADSLSITAEPNWLAEGEACELPFETDDTEDLVALQNRAREALDGLEIDTAVLPAENRRKKLLIADMDSTIIEQECIDELASVAGADGRIKEITARAMAGEIGFRDALRERLALLAGQPEGIIAEVIKKRLTFTPGARTLVQTMNANEAVTALISGGFTHFTSYVARMCGFQENQANILEIKDGKLTGEAVEPIIGQKEKLRALAQLTMMNGLTFGQTMAVGDGANDIPMLNRAGIGVSLHGKPIVREAARVRIDHGDLTSLLYLQGYRKDEFVTAPPAAAGVAITTS